MEELAARVPSPEQRVPSPEVRAPISQGPDYQATAEGTASAGGGVLKKVSRARARAEAEAAALMFARPTPRAQVIFVKEVPKPDAEASAGSSWFSYKGSTGRMKELAAAARAASSTVSSFGFRSHQPELITTPYGPGRVLERRADGMVVVRLNWTLASTSAHPRGAPAILFLNAAALGDGGAAPLAPVAQNGACVREGERSEALRGRGEREENAVSDRRRARLRPPPPRAPRAPQARSRPKLRKRRQLWRRRPRRPGASRPLRPRLLPPRRRPRRPRRAPRRPRRPRRRRRSRRTKATGKPRTRRRPQRRLARASSGCIVTESTATAQWSRPRR